MRVLVGLSGGVDSAVAAYLLQQEGFDVVGGFMKNYISESGSCTTYNDSQEAIKVANFLGIELLSFDMQKEYNDRIIEYIYDGYSKGITPNPDVLCNSLIKFDVFLEKAIEKGFDKIAMGHYARIVDDKKLKVDNYKLLRGVDYNKDQSYFLAGLNQYQLSKSLFPLGNLSKAEVRQIAKEIGLPNADRPDSQGLCFIGKIPIKQFLEQKLPKETGNIVLSDGKVVGNHQGAWFYTVGQRHGLGLNFKCYVIKTDVNTNTVFVGDKSHEELSHQSLVALDWHWIGQEYDFPLQVKTRIRYRQEPQPATIVGCGMLDDKCGVLLGKNAKSKNLTLKIDFKEPQRAIASGQVVAAYIGDECIGSGIIQ